MKTVLIFGASGAHGVGGAQGGWADKVKLSLYQDMYGPAGKGQQYEVYELGVVGDTARDIVGRFETEVLARLSSKNPGETYILFSAGANDSKARNQPDNYTHTPDDYATNVRAFIRMAQEYAKHILCIGLAPVNQAKTNPKTNPLNGEKSYFTNQRIRRFEDALVQVCKSEKIAYIPLFSSVPADWKQSYLYADGLHPTDAGHEWIFQQVQPKLRNMLKVR